jgi:hypothetical protein
MSLYSHMRHLKKDKIKKRDNIVNITSGKLIKTVHDGGEFAKKPQNFVNQPFRKFSFIDKLCLKCLK